jgi:SAM-dependent methyltransferase
MSPNQALWEKGDFTRVAAAMRASGAALVARLNLKSGQRVLDLGCGDGTTAIPAAQTGAEVLGVDIARNLVAAGNERAAQLGLTNCRFTLGDATNLEGIADKSFDLVLSIFGAMFAPKPDDVAKEMVRVTRPSGRIVMGNWIPGDPTLIAQVLRISAAYTPPPPPGFVSPVQWGVEETARARFVAAGVAPEQVRCTRETFIFEMPLPPSDYLGVFRNFYGPTMNAFEAAEAAGRDADLQAELEALFISRNESENPRHTRIPATYLQVEVHVT